MYSYNEQDNTVSYETAVSGTVTVDFKTFFTRQWVIAHLHWNGGYKHMISHEQWIQAYLLCDGFGANIDPLMASYQDYDWSHVRDSSDDAFSNVAQFLATAVNWFGGDFEAVYNQHVTDIERIQQSQPEVSMLLGVIDYNLIDD